MTGQETCIRQSFGLKMSLLPVPLHMEVKLKVYTPIILLKIPLCTKKWWMHMMAGTVGQNTTWTSVSCNLCWMLTENSFAVFTKEFDLFTTCVIIRQLVIACLLSWNKASVISSVSVWNAVSIIMRFSCYDEPKCLLWRRSITLACASNRAEGLD